MKKDPDKNQIEDLGRWCCELRRVRVDGTLEAII